MVRLPLLLLLCLVPLVLNASPPWLEDWSAALAASAKTGKPILVDVTGSDWAPPARRMELEVFSQPGFAAAADKYVLLRLDFPRYNGQGEKIRAQNAKLAEVLPIDNLPLTLVLDKTGFVWGLHEGAVDGGPDAFLALADALAKQKDQLTALQKDADAAPAGVEKAKKLHALFAAADNAGLAFEFGSVPAQILAADKDNKAGLANRYQVYAKYTRLLATWTSRDDVASVITDLSDLAAKAADQPDLKQKILFTRGMIQWNAMGAPLAAKASFLEALPLVKDTPTSQKIVRYLAELP